METDTNQFKRFKLRTHASPVVLIGQVHSEASVSPTAQEPPDAYSRANWTVIPRQTGH